MKTPAFWQSKNTLSNLLLPLASVYEMAATLRQAWAKPVRLPAPIICIGNLTAGGGGKTPLALYIGEKLKEKNIAAFFLSRGYGGKATGPLLVNPAQHSARDVGDEPLLLAQTLPTIVAKDRLAGALLAIQKGAKAIIMDDGFQNPSLAKNLSLIVIDGTVGLGNGRLIPAGPLREIPDIALKRAHVVVVVNRSSQMPDLPPDKPVLWATTQPRQDIPGLRGRKVVAFCGIAYPRKFSETLAGLGPQVVAFKAFPDHHPYSTSDLKKLIAQASKHQAILVTTAKDAVRLPPEIRSKVAVIDIALHLDKPAALDAILDYTLSHAKN